MSGLFVWKYKKKNYVKKFLFIMLWFYCYVLFVKLIFNKSKVLLSKRCNKYASINGYYFWRQNRRSKHTLKGIRLIEAVAKAADVTRYTRWNCFASFIVPLGFSVNPTHKDINLAMALVRVTLDLLKTLFSSSLNQGVLDFQFQCKHLCWRDVSVCLVWIPITLILRFVKFQAVL